MCRNLFIFSVLALLFFVAACGQSPSLDRTITGNQGEEGPLCSEADDSVSLPPEQEGPDQPLFTQGESGETDVSGVIRNSAACYKLQPSVSAQGKKKKNGSKTTSCCQPQSLIYARCRSGITTCRLGDTSPVQWFSCAKKMGNTTSVPAAGTIMVLDIDARRKIFTGHPVFVENVRKESTGTWLLRVSHTNYDRRCHLDQDAEVTYDPSKMTVSFKCGPWSCWCRDLKILGFIVH
jgi:hypothetical protein